MPAVPSGSFRLAEQIGGWAVFADITLSVVVRRKGQPLVTLDQQVTVDDIERQIASIGFGVAYALTYIAGSDDVGVIIHKLDTNPVDTTPMALAYATCRAVLKCFDGMPIKAPYFDRESRCFIFPARGPSD
jgi:hypothetical protein